MNPLRRLKECVRAKLAKLQSFLKEIIQLKVLKAIERIFRLVGAEEFLKSITSYIPLIGIFAMIATSATYLWINDFGYSKFSDCLIALLQLTSAFSACVIFISIGANMKKLKCLNNKLQDMAKTGKEYFKTSVTLRKFSIFTF